MSPLDYLIIGIVVLSAIVGAVRGLLREAIAVVTWLVALWGAWQFGSLVEPYLGGVLTDSPVRPWAARGVVFLLVLLLGAAIGAIAGNFVRVSIFSGTDRFLGFLFGLLRGAVVVGALLIVAQTLRFDEEPYWKKSRLLPYAEQMASVLRGMVGERWSRAPAIVEPASG
ncbi:MAG TPA: CvpA family protein, partial [Steroidobacteraceae bacterium]|nr:CvpA family protein [Steroidobacteraceae bacterium]